MFALFLTAFSEDFHKIYKNFFICESVDSPPGCNDINILTKHFGEQSIARQQDGGESMYRIGELSNSPSSLILTEQIIRFPGETASLICGPAYRITYEDGTMEIKLPVCRLSATPQAPRNDDIRADFENDDRVISHWELVDVLPSREQFLPDGEMRNTFCSMGEEPYTDGPEVWRWVTGNVICNSMSTVSMYRFQQYGDTEYLFIQWKSGDYTFGGQEPYWYVFQRKAEQ